MPTDRNGREIKVGDRVRVEHVVVGLDISANDLEAVRIRGSYLSYLSSEVEVIIPGKHFINDEYWIAHFWSPGVPVEGPYKLLYRWQASPESTSSSKLLLLGHDDEPILLDESSCFTSRIAALRYCVKRRLLVGSDMVEEARKMLDEIDKELPENTV